MIDNGQVRILLVDDTPVNLMIAGKALEKEGYDLYIADSGPLALELAKTTEFDLILLDIMMPDMDGFETYAQLRKLANYETVPILFLTAKVDIESVIHGFELGAMDFIRKTFNEAELKARVKTHVELKKTREELEKKNKSLQKAYEALEITASTDSLTQLFTRREMNKRMEYSLANFERNHRPFSVIIADIDFFKRINDTYGHECGDYVLISVANLLKDSIRKVDSAARWGGEEFLLLLPDTDACGAANLAEKIRNMVDEQVFLYKETSFRITMTLGICEYEKNMALDQLISNADRALYEGKETGRNRVMVFKK